MIDYGIIHHSTVYYESHGFKRIEAPWTVTSPISNITKPPSAGEFTIKEKDKVLVASGEQSFLALYNKSFLPKGKFQTVTPCFRDERFTPYHTKYFVKNELIVTDNVNLTELRKVVHVARDFFRQYCLRPKIDDCYVRSTTEPDDVLIYDVMEVDNKMIEDIDVNSSFIYHQYDLVYRGIELGSYGIRKCGFLKWIFGTGVAEPRLSRVMEEYGIPR